MQNIFVLFILTVLAASCNQQDKKQPEQVQQEKQLKPDSITSLADTVTQPVYKHYVPCSFGVSLPVGFTMKPMEEETNFDYCDYSVKTADGIEVMQLHSMLRSRYMSGEIKDLYQDALNDSGIAISYKMQKANWYVISGINKKNGNPIYWKTIAGNRFVGDLRIQYPTHLASKIEPFIGKIAGSFTSE